MLLTACNWLRHASATCFLQLQSLLVSYRPLANRAFAFIVKDYACAAALELRSPSLERKSSRAVNRGARSGFRKLCALKLRSVGRRRNGPIARRTLETWISTRPCELRRH